MSKNAANPNMEYLTASLQTGGVSSIAWTKECNVDGTVTYIDISGKRRTQEEGEAWEKERESRRRNQKPYVSAEDIMNSAYITSDESEGENEKMAGVSGKTVAQAAAPGMVSTTNTRQNLSNVAQKPTSAKGKLVVYGPTLSNAIQNFKSFKPLLGEASPNPLQGSLSTNLNTSTPASVRSSLTNPTNSAPAQASYSSANTTHPAGPRVPKRQKINDEGDGSAGPIAPKLESPDDDPTNNAKTPRKKRPSEVPSYKALLRIMDASGMAPDNIDLIVENIEDALGKPLGPAKKQEIVQWKSDCFTQKAAEYTILRGDLTNANAKIAGLESEKESLKKKNDALKKDIEDMKKVLPAKKKRPAKKGKGKEKVVEKPTVKLPLSVVGTVAPLSSMLDSAAELLGCPDQEDWEVKVDSWMDNNAKLPKIHYE